MTQNDPGPTDPVHVGTYPTGQAPLAGTAEARLRTQKVNLGELSDLFVVSAHPTTVGKSLSWDGCLPLTRHTAVKDPFNLAAEVFASQGWIYLRERLLHMADSVHVEMGVPFVVRLLFCLV